jgi:hypothetical protein
MENVSLLGSSLLVVVNLGTYKDRVVYEKKQKVLYLQVLKVLHGMLQSDCGTKCSEKIYQINRI